ncbi:histone deacetylase [Planctomycetales bacterium ZRK34]|nr:histone deacetylase [Planctomycetales bacterium ZRK34]
MKVGWVYHEDYLKHDTGPGHPERPDRLRAIVEAFRKTGLDRELIPIAPRAVNPMKLYGTHLPQYVKHVAQACNMGQTFIDSTDTTICPDSYDVALLAVGGVLAGMRQVMEGKVDRAFCTVRPPGHHAERDSATGFCLFNNIAVAADAAIAEFDLKRVAIVDFDVHHGNGTQHAFEHRNDVLFVSLHQDPKTLYPGMGYYDERGVDRGEGFTVNIPMAPGATDADYRRAFDEKALPALREFKPQLLFIDAGFDATADDAMAQVSLTHDAYTWMTSLLCEVADECCGGRVVSVLEGGYNLESLTDCVVKHVKALMGHDASVAS